MADHQPAPARLPRPAPLQTHRLSLEPLRVDHAEEMARVLSDPDLYRFIGGTPPSTEVLAQLYTRQTKGRSADGHEQWFNWVMRRRDDERLAGYVQATVLVATEPLSAEIAWVVGTEHQHQGLAREAAAAMVGWLFQQGIGDFVAHVHAEHGASQTVAEYLGLAPTQTIVDGEVRWSRST